MVRAVRNRRTIERTRFASEPGDAVTYRTTTLFGVLLVVTLMSALTGCQPADEGGMEQAAVDTTAIMSAADSLRRTYAEAYNAGDTTAVLSTLSPDFVFLPAQGPPIEGRRKVVSILGRGISMNQQIAISSRDVKVLGNDAVVDYGTATFTMDTPNADTAQTTHRHGYLMVAERTSDGWKLTRAANTRLQPLTSSKGSAGGR